MSSVDDKALLPLSNTFLLMSIGTKKLRKSDGISHKPMKLIKEILSIRIKPKVLDDSTA